MAEAHGLMIMLLIFLEKPLLANSKDANITCIIPDDCILPCSFRPTGTVVIHWYKQQIPVHSYYYNKDQFGLQNRHFSGRTCLFNSQIPHGNASLLLRRVKVQDKGRYKCYTSTRKGNQEVFVNLEVKALIQSVIMEMTEEMITCSAHNIYPVPQVLWTTDPPSAQEALEDSTMKTADHKGLFTVESKLRILGNSSNYTYFCSFISADKAQVWTASWKKQDLTQEEGHALSIPCIAPLTLHNFTLTWTFTSSSEPTVILRYDTKNRHMLNLWEGHAELDQELLLLADGSLLIHKPDPAEHSGTYTCTFSGVQSKHTVWTSVNITVSSTSVDEQRVQRSWWSTMASAAFFIFTIIIALPQCVRHRAMENRTATHRHNGAGFVELGIHKDIQTALYAINQHGIESSRLQLQFEAQDQASGSASSTAEEHALVLTSDDELKEEEETVESPVDRNDGLQSSSLEKCCYGSTEAGLHIT